MEVLMCPPEFYTVRYRINPWMEPAHPPNTALAIRQWERLREVYDGLGFTVHLLDPHPDFPDMVYAANGSTVIAGQAYRSNFRFTQRAGEADLYAQKLEELGFHLHGAGAINEGEGDFLLAGQQILAGYGPRTDLAAHAELQEITALPTLSLHLVDAHFYHLDTALTVLSDDLIAYYPPAFSPAGRAILGRLFPHAITASAADAHVLALNAVSDGTHVIHSAGATDFPAQLRSHGFTPIAVDTSELLKGGGGAKCCTLILRREKP